VARVGEQRHGVREHTVHRFDHHKCKVEAYAEGESKAEIPRCVMMVTVVIMIVVCVLVMMIVAHACT